MTMGRRRTDKAKAAAGRLDWAMIAVFVALSLFWSCAVCQLAGWIVGW